MKLLGRALILGFAVGGASVVGCSLDHSGAAADGSADSAPEGSAEGEADGALDSSASEGSFREGAADAALVDDAGDGASEGGSAGGLDAAVGTVVITADASWQATGGGGLCAAANSLAAAPNETSVGHAISLTASGIDSNNHSSDVTLTWVATGGAASLSGSDGTSNTMSCTSPGVETVTVTAAISDGGASCANIGSLTVILQCDP
jgi:hypothetical protein